MTTSPARWAIPALSALTFTVACDGLAAADAAASRGAAPLADRPVASDTLAQPPAEEDPGWLPTQSVRGVGRFVLAGPGVDGDQITFRVHGLTARTGLTTGRFGFRHHSPAEPGEPAWTARGVGRITCLTVQDDTALLTAVITRGRVPGFPDGVGPHAFYLKIADGSPDKVTFMQGPPPLASKAPYKTHGCEDPDVFLPPGQRPDAELLESGDWQIRSRNGR